MSASFLSAHPYFPEKGVDAQLFAGPTLSALSLDPHLVAYGDGDVVSIDTGYSPGFCAGGRILLDHDHWDASLLYYWNDGTFAQGEEEPQSLEYSVANDYPYSFHRSFPTSITADLSLNTLFLEIGRFITQHQTVRFHFGFVGTWETYSLYLEANKDPTRTDMRNTQDVRSAGLRCGFNARKECTSYLDIQGSCATSLAWSRYRVRRKDTQEAVQVINVESNYWKVSPGIDASISLIAKKAYPSWILSLSIDAFLQVWMNHTRFFLLTNPQQQGDIAVQGVGITAAASF